MFTVAINGKKVIRCGNHNDARNIASRLYEAYADIILEGSTEDDFSARTLHQYDIVGKVVITISGRNWEEFIANEDKISNRIAIAH